DHRPPLSTGSRGSSPLWRRSCPRRQRQRRQKCRGPCTGHHRSGAHPDTLRLQLLLVVVLVQEGLSLTRCARYYCCRTDVCSGGGGSGEKTCPEVHHRSGGVFRTKP
ncbi:unnamed protein product, partial [Laminaria digitata]